MRRIIEIASDITLTAAVAVVGLAIFAPSVAAAPKINWLAVKTPMQIQNFRRIFSDFTKDTGIKVSPTPCKYSDAQDKMLLAAAAGRMFEMVTSGTDFVHYADVKTLVPLDKYIKADKYDTSKQSKIALRSFTYKKQLWGMPYASYPVVLFYNKNLFDKAGVPYPTVSWEDKSWNWDAFLDVARKLTVTGPDGKIVQAGISGMQWHYFWPWYFGGDWSDEDAKVAKLNDPKTAKGIQEVADLWLKYKVADQGGSFNSSKAAMTVDGVWTMSDLHKVKNLQWNIAPTPWGTQHSVPAFVDAFSIGNGKNKDQMWDFIKWMYKDKSRVQRWIDADSGGAALPSDKDLMAKYIERGKVTEPGIDLKVAVDAMDYATPLYLRYNKNWVKIDQLIGDAMGKITSGKKSAKDGLDEIQPAVSKLL